MQLQSCLGKRKRLLQHKLSTLSSNSERISPRAEFLGRGFVVDFICFDLVFDN